MALRKRLLASIVGTSQRPKFLEGRRPKYKSLLTKEQGICKDWDGLLGFVLITPNADGQKYCNQLCCTVRTCEYHLMRDFVPYDSEDMVVLGEHK